VGSGTQRGTVAGGEAGRREGRVVRDCGNQFDCLAHREGVRTGAARGDFLVQVVAQLLERDDVAQGVRDMGVGRDHTLRFAVVGDRRALRLHDRVGERGDLHGLFIGLVRGTDIVKVRVLGRVLVVDLTPRLVDAGPEQLRV